MKKYFYTVALLALAGTFAACGGGNKKTADATQTEESATTMPVSYSKALQAAETDTLTLPIDKDGYITIFDGKITGRIGRKELMKEEELQHAIQRK